MADLNPLAGLPATAKARLRETEAPRWIAPMLATLTDERFSRVGWLFEPKWDGERCLAFRRGRDLSLFSRNRKRLNDKYPEITEALIRQKNRSFVADGEIVTFQDGVTSFARLQERMQIEHPSPELLHRVPVSFCLFDLLYFDCYDTRHVQLRYRKELLGKALNFVHPLRFTEHCETEGEAYYRMACRRGWEGVVAKNGNSEYLSARTRDWLKFKCQKAQEFVIGGYTDPRGTRVGFGALVLGFYRRGKLVHAGMVGTGFNHDTLRRLSGQLRQLESPTSPFANYKSPRRGVHWVKPKLVAQVGFTEWTQDDKLRHPRFLGLREDKRPQDVVREG